MTSPVALSMSITNTFGETRSSAQYIGDLNSYGSFDIALTGTLAARDKGDYYKFRVTSNNTFIRLATIDNPDASSTGTTQPSSLAALVDSGELRYQLYSQTGHVIADSDPNSGDAFTAYQQLTSGTNLSLGAGNYTVRVSPGDNATPNTAYDYSLSLQSGSSPIPDDAPITSREEFQTTASAATSNGNTSQTGWLPSVILTSSATTSMFSALQTFASNAGVGGSIDLTG